MKQEIKWELFDSPYVKLEDAEPVDLVLANWTPITKTFEGKETPGVRFDVKQQDGREVNKVYDVTSRILIQTLKPFVESAEKEGKSEFKCRIIRTGTGTRTAYNVKGLEA